jgi:hypothetical protein
MRSIAMQVPARRIVRPSVGCVLTRKDAQRRELVFIGGQGMAGDSIVVGDPISIEGGCLTRVGST